MMPVGPRFAQPVTYSPGSGCPVSLSRTLPALQYTPPFRRPKLSGAERSGAHLTSVASYQHNSCNICTTEVPLSSAGASCAVDSTPVGNCSSGLIKGHARHGQAAVPNAGQNQVGLHTDCLRAVSVSRAWPDWADGSCLQSSAARHPSLPPVKRAPSDM